MRYNYFNNSNVNKRLLTSQLNRSRVVLFTLDEAGLHLSMKDLACPLNSEMVLFKDPFLAVHLNTILCRLHINYFCCHLNSSFFIKITSDMRLMKLLVFD